MSRSRSAAVVVVGDELLAGAHPDANSPAIARHLARVGLPLHEVRVVPDDELAIAHAVAALSEQHAVVLVSGGLGPTLDDVTREGIARAFGLSLAESPRARADLERWFAGRGAPMPAVNLRQARLPVGAELVPNRAGTAPGFHVRAQGGHVLSLPGPPRELLVVLVEEVVPRLVDLGLAREPLGEHRFHLFGLSESAFGEEAGDWMEREADPRMGCSAKDGALHIVLRARGDDGAALAALAERVTRFRERFGHHVYAEGEEARMPHVLGAELVARGVGITLAESCTAGLATALLAEVPGISAVLDRAWVTYSDAAKVAELGVAPERIARYGAVSTEVAEEMALGAARESGAPLAVSITGIAGPEGGTPEKPVGLVCFATSFRGEVRSFARAFPAAGRDWVRAVAARTALNLALGRVRELDAAGPEAPPAD